MDEYIDKQQLISAPREKAEQSKGMVDARNAVLAIANSIEAMPSADVVEVVRCKDCRYFNKTFPLLHLCNLSCMKMEIDDYCSRGERKDG